MKVIIGIGNPGSKYINTRHNVGFQILDSFCEKHSLKFRPTKSNFWSVESNFNTFHFFLVKPATYVNNSGIAIKEILENIEPEISNYLIIYDDINLEAGKIRIRKSGGDGGHNGLKSIIYHLNHNNFARLRIGIGNPKNIDLADFVLSEPTEEEAKLINSNTNLIIDLLEEFILGGTDKMLNFYSNFSNNNLENNSKNK
ncbi:MAG: aminoacyl-tRNA hydrolase [Ignavibacteriae bacterium]|nr:MAG: aminoacyl-tRNA hydrolase [Ignavibacteriota bacterium]